MFSPEAKLQDAVNDAYLWVWDRTGISVSMLVLPLWVAEVPLVAKSVGAGQWAVLGVLGLVSGYRHMAQMSAKFELCNEIANSWRCFTICRWIPYLFTILPLLFRHITDWRWWLDLVVVILWVNLWGCLVRERKLIEKPVRAKLAMQRT